MTGPERPIDIRDNGDGLVLAIDRETGLASYGIDHDEAIDNLLDVLDLYDGFDESD